MYIILILTQCQNNPGGDFMPRLSKELTESRRDEIMDVCVNLYKKKIFKDITIKDIGEVTSFTRTSIYNYFETKEEIFLAIFKREYDCLTDDLLKIIKNNDSLSREQLAGKIADVFKKRELLLKLLSVNLYDMEENSRIERLVDFKQSYGASKGALEKVIKKFNPSCKSKELNDFIYVFLPYLNGVYPYAHPTDKQVAAMAAAGVKYKEVSIRNMIYKVLIKILP